MEEVLRECEELIRIDNALWLLTATAGVPAYDFPFAKFFPFERAWELPAQASVVARIGALQDYRARYDALAVSRLALINSPEQHLRASRLPEWYALLDDLTPRSRWFEKLPTPGDVEQEFDWPVFVKGERQTDRHSRKLSFAGNAEEFAEIVAAYQEIPLLRWQRITIREFVKLRLVEDPDRGRIPSSFEFRTFWWKGKLVGLGPYWFQGKQYQLSQLERRGCIEVAEEAARRVDVPFLVIDVAQQIDGRWIVIECNDGQESGYSGISPLGLWQQIIEIEKSGVSS